MDYKEMKKKVADLEAKLILRDELIEANDGEITPEVEAVMIETDELRELLTQEGTDVLGEWLKEKEDQIQQYKAQRDFVTRKIARTDRMKEFIKTKLNEVMTVAEVDKVKGNLGYSFTKTVKTTTEVDKVLLKEMFGDMVKQKLAGAIPEDVTVTLGASVSLVPDGAALPAYYHQNSTPSVRCVKPRASKGE